LSVSEYEYPHGFTVCFQVVHRPKTDSIQFAVDKMTVNKGKVDKEEEEPECLTCSA